MTSTAIQPWERQHLEDEKSWEGFRIYRDSGYPDGYDGAFRARTVRYVATCMGVSIAAVGALCARFSWPERAGAFDRELERRRYESSLDQRARIRLAHERILEKTRGLVEVQLDLLLGKTQAGVEVTPSELRGLLELQMKYDLLLTGQATENHAHAHVHVSDHGLDLTRLTPDEFTEFRRLVEKVQTAA